MAGADRPRIPNGSSFSGEPGSSACSSTRTDTPASRSSHARKADRACAGNHHIISKRKVFHNLLQNCRSIGAVRRFENHTDDQRDAVQRSLLVVGLMRYARTELSFRKGLGLDHTKSAFFDNQFLAPPEQSAMRGTTALANVPAINGMCEKPLDFTVCYAFFSLPSDAVGQNTSEAHQSRRLF